MRRRKREKEKAGAKMSVLGLDFGNESSVVGIARKKGIDVLLNNESKRETPSMVGFTEKQRALGTAAAAGFTMNYKNTVNQIKRLIGRSGAEKGMDEERSRCFFETETCGTTGGVLIKVRYLGEEKKFTPTEVLAMLLGELARIAEAEHGAKVPDCVVSVPCYFTDAQRHAVMDAASIAGLKCLRLMNDMTAVALGYGIYKQDLPAPEEKPLRVAFVDVGHSDMQVAIVAYSKGTMKVLGHAFDRSLGGRDFDDCLVDHFAEEFKTTYKIDVKSRPRALFRLREAAAKSKKVLSANAETPLNIECLMDDIDVRSKITREKFEELSADLLARVLAPCEVALEKSGVSVDDISIVELVGNSSRIPAISTQISSFFKREVSRHLNASECVARGCALQGAMLSPTFRFTREFDVQDAACYPVAFSWASEPGAEEEASANDANVFDVNNSVPSTKMLTFYRSNNFDICARYAAPELLPAGANLDVGKFTLGPIPPSKTGEKQKVKVKVRLNIHGTVGVESAQAVEEEEEEEVAMEDADAKPAAADGAAEAAAPMDTDAAAPASTGGEGDAAAAAAAAPMETEEAEKKKKKKIKRTDIAVQSSLCKLAPHEINKYNEKEFEMCFQDRIIEETKEKKNDLEEYVLKMRSRLYGDLEPYIAASSRDALVSVLTATEDWLYEDGEDETKGVYTDKLNELKEKGNVVVMRYTEDQSRASAANGLVTIANDFKTKATSGDAKYSHIGEEDLGRVVKECDAALAWLEDKSKMQEATPKTDPPVLLCAEITKKRDVLLRVAEPIMNKPAPPPAAAKPKPAAAPEPANGANGAAPEAAEAETAAGEAATGAADTTMADGTADDLD